MNDFKDITAYPASYSGATAMLRLLDGIGFRYYWGTEGLTKSDMSLQHCDDGRTIYQTLDHVRYMATFTANVLAGKPTSFPEQPSGLSFAEIRSETLDKLGQIRTHWAATTDQDLGVKKVTGTVNGDAFEAPIWHLFNGPLLDLGHHIGQIWMIRRLNGNPIDSNVEPFFGRRME